MKIVCDDGSYVVLYDDNQLLLVIDKESEQLLDAGTPVDKWIDACDSLAASIFYALPNAKEPAA